MLKITVIASAAKQSSAVHLINSTLDCFAALAMTVVCPPKQCHVQLNNPTFIKQENTMSKAELICRIIRAISNDKNLKTTCCR
jgi:hypothetical protein